MTKLLGLKKELQHVDYMSDVGKTYHILFNKYYNTFLASPLNLGICLNSKSIENGWVDITELCEWFDRKVNYSNCRMYALKVLENDGAIMEHVKVYKDVILSYEELDSENINFSDETCCINNIYGEIIEKCESSNYGYYGVRCDYCYYESGDFANNSVHLMQYPEYFANGELIYPLCTDGVYKGFYVGPMLPGTCVIMFYDLETLDFAIKELNNGDKISLIACDKITVIAGDTFEYEEYFNEVIIHNSRVIAQYNKDELKNN